MLLVFLFAFAAELLRIVHLVVLGLFLLVLMLAALALLLASIAFLSRSNFTFAFFSEIVAAFAQVIFDLLGPRRLLLRVVASGK